MFVNLRWVVRFQKIAMFARESMVGRASIVRISSLILMLFNIQVLHAAAQTELDDMWNSYDLLLEKHVVVSIKQSINVNLVDYDAFATSSAFAKLVSDIRSYPVETLVTKPEKLAFFINAYNILTIQLIVDEKPKRSIKEIGNFFKGPWSQIVLRNSLGKLSLDDIEHKNIRPLGEPRIHFAVNCASISCPDIRREAYRSGDLEAQLDDQTKLFLAQEKKGLAEEGEVVRLSNIFDWYASDFEQVGGVNDFIARYKPALAGKTLAYFTYNWSLNKQ